MNELVDPKQARQWAMLMHFSIFLGYIIPIFGLIAPVVMWQMKKDEYADVDQHGKNIVNFLISMLIYSVVSFFLMFVVIGFFLLIALSIASVVLPIMAAIKANNGEVWKYPFTLTII
jgi:uncharacterized protein